MAFAVCCVPVSPLRAEPSHKSEMVSQMVFGECCEIKEEGKEKWLRVQCLYDHYEGWCTQSHVTEIDDADHTETNLLSQDWVNRIEYNGQLMMIPMGSPLMLLKNGHAHWGTNAVNFQGKIWDVHDSEFNERSLKHLAFQFLNTPYLWGGKSVLGTDCSGFTQTVFRFFNIHLLRDASQQASQGKAIGFLQEARWGDLAFFDNSEGRITHVGILLNDSEIIHASGKVHIDKIDNLGIIHSETFERTHQLRIIKRFF
jgi:cell wall-associated NlpC family hydrolase